jgi:hydrogenase maturation protease
VNASVADVLVVGYGNDLRSDDGAGRWVADRIDEMGLDGVEVRSMAQLTPEVSLQIEDRDLVVFVDASVAVSELTVADLDPAGGTSTGPGSVMTHHGDPASVLAMAAAEGHVPSRSVLVSIPAAELGMGFTFTEGTMDASRRAVEAILELVNG